MGRLLTKNLPFFGRWHGWIRLLPLWGPSSEALEERLCALFSALLSMVGSPRLGRQWGFGECLQNEKHHPRHNAGWSPQLDCAASQATPDTTRMTRRGI